MTEFKVGDKVRLLDVGKITLAEYLGFKNGMTTTVYEVFDGNGINVIDVVNGGELFHLTERELKYIELIESKPTKKQRITALEETVATLTEQLQALQQRVDERFEPSTVVVSVEGDTAALAKAIEKTTAKTTNELRGEIIEKAKSFIDKRDKGVHINVHDNTIIAYKLDTADFGIAKCNPSDVFNEHIGKAIALGRALGLDVSEFENAVQPTEIVIGQIVKSDLNGIGGVALKSDKENYSFDYAKRNNLTIINDTNAQNGGGE